MLVAMWNCHSWPLDVSSNVKLPFCIRGSICQNVFMCQVLCTGIQGIHAQFVWWVHLPKCFPLPSFAYWCWRHLCSIFGAIYHSVFICQWLCTGIQGIYFLLVGVHLPKCVHLPSVVNWNSRHLCYIHLGGGPSAKVCLSAMCCVLEFKVSILYSWRSICQKCVHLPISVYWYSRHLYYILQGGPSAKVCSSAKCCVLEFKASMVY